MFNLSRNSDEKNRQVSGQCGHTRILSMESQYISGHFSTSNISFLKTLDTLKVDRLHFQHSRTRNRTYK